ncbi:MAG TPA: hypothetical protein VG992_03675 [Candidatus Saccharimonadales bacterium]|nr:hypothetical protein [Candidatus Saccharimonadales bacterium]
MSVKTKSSQVVDQIHQAAEQAGLVLMSAAVTLGMIEMPDHPNARIVLPNQPILAVEENSELNNPLRREKEEVEQHYISYSVAQRTPARSASK